MSKEKRDESAARHDENQRLWLALTLPIGHILRRAAGLPDEEDPFIERSDEAHLPNLQNVTDSVVIEAHYNVEHRYWRNPRTVGAKLEAIRRDIKRLKQRIASVDLFTVGEINFEGDPAQIEYEAAKLSGDIDRIQSAWALEGAPYEQMVVPAALSAMERLEAAIVVVIEQTIDAGAQLPENGRIPNLEKNGVALLVAQYLKDVTGNIPGLTTRPVVTGPFALALQEIFEILGLPKGVQKPGKDAKLKLTSELSKKS